MQLNRISGMGQMTLFDLFGVDRISNQTQNISFSGYGNQNVQIQPTTISLNFNGYTQFASAVDFFRSIGANFNVVA